MIIGADIGGTATKLGIFTKNGELLHKWSIDTVITSTGEKIISNTAESIFSVLHAKGIEKERICGIGLGVPAPVTKDGVIESAVNLGWNSRRDVSKEMFELTKIKTFAGNDANLAALGEAWKGAAKTRKNVVMLTLGTGVGGGIICNGELLFGAHGMAGEIGHLHMEDREDLPCGCGSFGCLEQLSSATGIVNLAKYLMEQSQISSILDKNKVTAKDVFDAYKKKDELAAVVVDLFAKYLARALVNISMVVDPEIFVIGGGVSAAGEELLKPIIKYYKEFMSFSLCDNNEFVLAALGNDAGIYGAARLVISSLGLE